MNLETNWKEIDHMILMRKRFLYTSSSASFFAFHESVWCPAGRDPTIIWLTKTEDQNLGVTNLAGTAELFVQAKNPHGKNRGKWNMIWIVI